MAIFCLAVVCGLTLMFVNFVVVGPLGTPRVDVALAAWSWMVVISSITGLIFFWRVANTDPRIRIHASAVSREEFEKRVVVG